MLEVAGGVVIAIIVLFGVLPISTSIIGLMISHIFNMLTSGDIISDELASFSMFLGFIISVIIIFFILNFFTLV